MLHCSDQTRWMPEVTGHLLIYRKFEVHKLADYPLANIGTRSTLRNPREILVASRLLEQQTTRGLVAPSTTISPRLATTNFHTGYLFSSSGS
jgi:hypothetical protein